MNLAPGMITFYIDAWLFHLSATGGCEALIVYCPACLDSDEDEDMFDVYTDYPVGTTSIAASSLEHVVIE